MSVIKQAPNQPYVETQGRFDWEDDETLVDRRNRLPNRIMRLFRQTWLWLIIIAVVAAALLDAGVMKAVIAIGGAALQVGLLIGIFVFQFILMFWFLARSRMYTI